jgi:hypothetical protein
VVGLVGSDKAIGELESEVVRLSLQVRRLRCILRLLLVLLKLSGFRLELLRLPEGKNKQRLLWEVDRASQIYPLRKVLGMIRLSPSRYHAWVRKSECGLTDMPSCPGSIPSQLTLDEVSAIREMITGNVYRHVPTTRLSILAQRMGKVHASASTWIGGPIPRLKLTCFRMTAVSTSAHRPQNGHLRGQIRQEWSIK